MAEPRTTRRRPADSSREGKGRALPAAPTGEDSASVRSVIGSVREDLELLLGQPVERVASAVREDGGWRLTLDVVELARIPDSTSVLGSYEVSVDGHGEIVEYERIRRFTRNRVDEEAW